jgi:hypothetical protein
VPSPARYLDPFSAPLSLPFVLFQPFRDLACYRLSTSLPPDRLILPSQLHRRGRSRPEIVSPTSRAFQTTMANISSSRFRAICENCARSAAGKGKRRFNYSTSVMSRISQQWTVRGLEDMHRDSRNLLTWTQIVDKPGSEDVTLTRTFGDET